MIGARLMLDHQWLRPGVWNMEQFDPDPFMDLLTLLRTSLDPPSSPTPFPDSDNVVEVRSRNHSPPCKMATGKRANLLPGLPMSLSCICHGVLTSGRKLLYAENCFSPPFVKIVRFVVQSPHPGKIASPQKKQTGEMADPNPRATDVPVYVSAEN